MTLDKDQTVENVKNFFDDEYTTALDVSLMKPKEVLSYRLANTEAKNNFVAKALNTIEAINQAYDRLDEPDRDIIREVYILGKADQHLIKKFGVGRTKYYLVIKPRALLHFAATFENGRLLVAKKVDSVE